MKFKKDTKEIIKLGVLLIFLLAAGFGWFSPLRSKVDASGGSTFENERMISEGIIASRKKGSFNESCASCHSPDMIELAVYNFSDDTLRRRARAHVSAEDTEKIVAMIHALRDKHHLKKLLNPMTDRPLQARRRFTDVFAFEKILVKFLGDKEID